MTKKETSIKVVAVYHATPAGKLWFVEFRKERRLLQTYDVIRCSRIQRQRLRQCLHYAKQKGLEKEVLSVLLSILKKWQKLEKEVLWMAD